MNPPSRAGQALEILILLISLVIAVLLLVYVVIA